MSTGKMKDGAGDSTGRSVDDILSPDGSITMKVAELFYPTYKRFFEGTDLSKDVEENLGKANINQPVEIYLSQTVGISVLVTLLVAGGATLFFSVFGFVTSVFPEISAQSLPFSGSQVTQIVAQFLTQFLSLLFPLVFGLLIGGMIGIGVFGFKIYYPRWIKRTRAREIDMLVSDAIAFMYSLSVGGTNQIQVIHAIADAQDTYGEVSVEFQRIASEMKYFNTDYETAVENAIQTTPNEELEAFLSDMLSVINSGGNMTNFLETQHEMMQERSQKKQEEMLDTMEFFGEMYMSLNILPMGLLIVLVIVSMMGQSQLTGLYMTVYAIIPALNLLFALLVSTVKQDEPGDGTLDTEGKTAALGEDETDLRDLGVIDYYRRATNNSIFDTIRRRELQHRIKTVLQSPWEYFRLRPMYILWLTIPATIVMMGMLIATGLAELSLSAFTSEQPYTQTVMWFYVPVLMNVIPLALFYEWNRRTRGRITDSLTQDIRKLANANETGQPVLESIRIAAAGEDTVLASEFRQLYKKAKFGTSLSPALVEFNNRYRIPRLARVVKLIQKAQESSSNITQVLEKAATTSKAQDELVSDRKQRTRMQVAVTGITFLVFLGVLMMLDVYFIGEMIAGADMGGTDQQTISISLDGSLLSMLFFHAVTLQALFAGAVSGYVQTGMVKSGLKYISAYMLLTAFLWGVVTL